MQSLKQFCVVFVVLRTDVHVKKKLKEGEKIYPIYCTYTFLYRKKKAYVKMTVTTCTGVWPDLVNTNHLTDTATGTNEKEKRLYDSVSVLVDFCHVFLTWCIFASALGLCVQFQ